MKTNKEKILKYISGGLTQEDQIMFEEELKKSDQLKTDYDNIKFQLDEITITRESKTDEMYFANLLPRVYQRIDKKKKFRKFRNIYYLVPTASAVVVLFLFLLNTKTNYDTGYKDLANEVVNNLSDQEVSDKYLTELEIDPSDYVLNQNNDELSVQIPSSLELNSDSYTRLIGDPLANEYSTLRNLTDNDLETVYKKLNSTTSQKVLK
ncbi:MAG: hypothetical protein NTZ27_06120 [Ignavibacteriales bacterium]|nr:hypothetical protein [Ignavibacteriales bacterium]